MRSYPEYVYSGISWLGQIPKHWKQIRLKHCCHINPSKSNSEFDRESDQQVAFLPMEKVSEAGEIDTSFRKPISELWNGFTYFEVGDTIFAKITPCFENGKGAYLQHLGSQIGFGSTEFHVLRPLEYLSTGNFLYYLTFSHVFRKTGEAFMTGAAGQKRVPTQFVEEFQVALPPLNEQKSLTEFLNRKTTQIDDLIARKLRLIELLQEQRTALINRAVTKGLNPDAPMKDSGIEWLGEVPAHWKVIKFKHCASIANGQVDPRLPEYKNLILIAPNHIESGTGKLLYLETADEQGAES